MEAITKKYIAQFGNCDRKFSYPSLIRRTAITIRSPHKAGGNNEGTQGTIHTESKQSSSEYSRIKSQDKCNSEEILSKQHPATILIHHFTPSDDEMSMTEEKESNNDKESNNISSTINDTEDSLPQLISNHLTAFENDPCMAMSSDTISRLKSSKKDVSEDIFIQCKPTSTPIYSTTSFDDDITMSMLVGTESKQISSEESGEECLPQQSLDQLTSFDDEDSFRKLIYDVNPVYDCIRDESIGLRFIPPVYIQRYLEIANIFKKPCWTSAVKKVVDFGCAELKFECYLMKIEGIEEIISVDIDEELLACKSCILAPSIPDFLRLRSAPLRVRIFAGSVGNTNEVLTGCDAVVAIELIEHLFPPDLENLPFTVFRFIQPRIAVFTTPNADFNVLFTNFTGFRHDDHKFEWSRQQFEDWANNLVSRYPNYSVTFQGIGPGPTGTEHLGCCSQMAIFVKICGSYSTVTQDELHIQDGDYKLIKEYEYPYETRTREEMIRDDAISFINKQISLSRYYQEGMLKEMPLTHIMKAAKCFNKGKLRSILAENNWEVKIDESGCEVIIIPDEESEDKSMSDASEDCVNQDEDIIEQTELSNLDEHWDSEIEDKEYLNLVESTDDSNVNNNWGVTEKEPRESLNGDSKSCVDSSSSHNIECASSDSQMKTCNQLNNIIESTNYSNFDDNSSFDKKGSKITLNCDFEDSNAFPKNKNVCHKLLSFEENWDSDEKEPNECLNESDLNNVADLSRGTNLLSASETDCSIYETPFNNGLPSDLSTNQTSNVHKCSKQLFSSSKHHICKQLYPTECLHCTKNDPDESRCSMTTVISSPSSSTYNTPCCSRHHMTCLPNCLSDLQINAESNSTLHSEVNRLPKLSDISCDCKSDKAFDIQNDCDICETDRYTDVSKNLVDSDHSLELDLTFEQLDETITGSEEKCKYLSSTSQRNNLTADHNGHFVVETSSEPCVTDKNLF